MNLHQKLIEVRKVLDYFQKNEITFNLTMTKITKNCQKIILGRFPRKKIL